MVRRKKSYNPFKMWGSWIGAYLFIALNTLLTLMSLSQHYTPSFLPSGLQIWNSLMWIFLSYKNYLNIEGFFYLIVGFLIGWGIHSLVRRYRKW